MSIFMIDCLDGFHTILLFDWILLYGKIKACEAKTLRLDRLRGDDYTFYILSKFDRVSEI